MFKIECEHPLPSLCKERYSGLAYDGRSLYLSLMRECKILQLDECFKCQKTFDTCRMYNKLCYDPSEKCFWASADKCVPIIYKLNECFQETDCIYINNFCVSGMITGISYNCCCNTLIVSFETGIVTIDKNCPKESTVIIKSCREIFMGVVSVCPYIVCYCKKDNKNIVRIYTSCGDLVEKYIIPCDITIESAMFFPCVKDFCRCHFYVLVSKHFCYPYILDCVLNCDELCKHMCKCNYQLVDTADECDCKDKQNRDCECGKAVESIALIQASLAHILNAEGEKIQKILATSNNVCEILEVNKSVQKTLVKVTNIEQLLHCNLEALTEYCTPCNNCLPCNNCSPCNDDDCKHCLTFDETFYGRCQ